MGWLFVAIYDSQVLQAWGVDDAAALTTRLAPICNDTLPLLTAILERTSMIAIFTITSVCFDFAHVVDVSWRLDYVLRSSTAGSVHEPLYFVDLTLQEPSGQFTKRAFTCTVEELRDLVYRLQEASNAIEKLAGR
ncbi:TPA: hypothetical protein N0F65_009237 [Lagenidium giganteum]|uniref:COMM domain-containing protein 3 n=1 Tax=Lagenidium giganteum TaxID=4803 RepID=A0AAV2YVS0_9STRA|nr:TPA: hypothetical protein N0F65_009237 [Lagenidium giganteum]